MVDDEEIVRRGFRRKIDWTRLDFEFLEPCENGEQAIEAMEALRPDVIMTDIAMPHVDGLGVAAYAAEHHPEIVIGSLEHPLIEPGGALQDGYVPNVVYSCGGLVHDGVLWLPYGVGDDRVRVSSVVVEELLDAMGPVDAMHPIDAGAVPAT